MNHREELDGSEKSFEKAETKSETHHRGTTTHLSARGVQRIEEMKYSLDHSNKSHVLKAVFGVSILVTAWAAALDSATTSSYNPNVTSFFGHHSMLSTLSIATSIISSVCKPIFAKIADLTLRPYTYMLVLFLYVLGYIIVASSRSISAFVIGEVFVNLGSSGLALLNSVIIADLTPLKWRGLATSMLSTPYLINPWFAGLIVEAMLPDQWRWGFGMFALIMPVSIVPAITVLMYFDSRTQKAKQLEVGYEKPQKNWKALIKTGLIEADAFGMLLMGFGWSLLLLPFSLYPSAVGGWQNPSMIAMVVVGGVLLIAYFTYNALWAPVPSMPLRVIRNRTFLCAVVIDFIWQFGGMISLLYFSSYVWVVKDWNPRDWTYFNNTLTMALCFFGVVGGAIQRYTHRYKYLQVGGIMIKIIGYGIMLDGMRGTTSTAALVMSQILVGGGGALSVVASGVASQAAVFHEDVSQVIALLSLWSGIGAAIGSTIAGSIWSNKLPGYLREYLPSSVSDATVADLFSNFNAIQAYPYESEIRQASIAAYRRVAYYLFVPAVGLSFITLIAALFQTNYYLGDQLTAAKDSDQDAQSEDIKGINWRKVFGGVEK